MASRYEEMFGTNAVEKPSSLMNQGEYFISRPGQEAQTNIAGLAGKNIEVAPNPEQMQQAVSRGQQIPSGYQTNVQYAPAPVAQVPEAIQQGGSYNIPNVARPQGDESINPLGLPLSDVQVLQRRLALQGSGSVAGRNAIKSQIEREHGQVAQRQQTSEEQRMYDRETARKVAVAQAPFTGEAGQTRKDITNIRGESALAVQESKAATAERLLNKKFDFTQSRDATLNDYATAKQLSQQAFASGQLDKSQEYAKSAIELKAHADMEKSVKEGKIIGTAEHDALVQEGIQSGAYKDQREAEQDIARLQVKSILELAKNGAIPNDQVMGRVADIMRSERETAGAAVKTAAPQEKYTSEQISGAKKLVLSVPRKDAAAKYANGQWTDDQYTRYLEAEKMAKLAERQLNAQVESKMPVNQ